MKAMGLPAMALLSAAGAPRDVRATLIYLSSALANGNPSDAMTVFAKSCPGYGQLADYFDVLTTSYQIASEVEIIDESTSAEESEVEANWTLSLTSVAAKTTDRRTQAVKIQLRRKKSGYKAPWQIVSFTPIDLFNPQPAENSKKS